MGSPTAKFLPVSTGRSSIACVPEPIDPLRSLRVPPGGYWNAVLSWKAAFMGFEPDIVFCDGSDMMIVATEDV